MKKFTTGVIVAIFMAAGLVAAAGTTATAGDPYPGSVPTQTTATYKAVVKHCHHQEGEVSVTAAGNAMPTGRLRFTFTHAGGSPSHSKTVPYHGGVVRYRSSAGLCTRGRWTMTVTYLPRPGSIYQSSSFHAEFRVAKKPGG
jgi:hypothetical protein